MTAPSLEAMSNSRDVSFTKCKVESQETNSMVDSGSTNTHMSRDCAERRNLYILPKAGSVPLANNQKASISGEVVVNIEIGGHMHTGVVVNVIDNLFIDLIVGKDILKRHKTVTMKFDGPEGELVIGAVPEDEMFVGAIPEGEIFPCMKVEPPPLFTNLSENIKPIATKSRRHTPGDMEFMRKEIERLYRCGVIRPSVSPWRAQAM